MDLNTFEQDLWDRMRKEVRQLQTRVNRNEVHERIEVGRAVPVYADYASLPTGAQGNWAGTVTGNLYYHDGSAWKLVLFVDPTVSFTITNLVADYVYDASGSSVNELANVVGALIEALGLKA